MVWVGEDGGAGLARGYLGRPALTAASFVPHGLAGSGDRPGDRLYRTGDRCRLRDDGMLVLLGRDSTVINTGGEKVYTVEVERVLLEHPDVGDVIVRTTFQTIGCIGQTRDGRRGIRQTPSKHHVVAPIAVKTVL